jgi:hypothetical protein
LDEDEQFFAVVESLKRDDLIALVATGATNEREFLNDAFDAEQFDMDRLGEQVARMIEMRSGGMVRKGVILMKASLWRRVRHEMNLLLCTKDKKYAPLRKQLSKESGSTHIAVVGIIAAAVSSELGVVPGMLVPLVALLLAAVLKLSKEAYCAGLSA